VPLSQPRVSGEQLTVIRDPKGLVDPRLPEEFTDAVDTAPLMIPLTVAVMAGFCVRSARSRAGTRDREPKFPTIRICR
jgi:hypothetical protein